MPSARGNRRRNAARDACPPRYPSSWRSADEARRGCWPATRLVARLVARPPVGSSARHPTMPKTPAAITGATSRKPGRGIVARQLPVAGIHVSHDAPMTASCADARCGRLDRVPQRVRTGGLHREPIAACVLGRSPAPNARGRDAGGSQVIRTRPRRSGQFASAWCQVDSLRSLVLDQRAVRADHLACAPAIPNSGSTA